MIRALRLGLAILILSGATARSMAAEVEIPVTASADIRNLDGADQNFLTFTSGGTGNKSSWQLIVRSSSAPGMQSFKTYLQADAHGQAGPDRPLASAKVVLTGVASDGSQSARPVSLSLYGITDHNDQWGEGEITWNNAPKNDAESPGGIQPEGTVLLAEVQLAGIVKGEPVEFESEELTKYLNWKAGALPDAFGTGPVQSAKATFILVASPKSGTLRFYSRQHKAKDPAQTSLLEPRLVVQQPAP